MKKINLIPFALLASSLFSIHADAAHQANLADYQCSIRGDRSSICINDRVIDYRNYPGVLQQIYSNNVGVVLFDNGETNVIDLQYLGREVQCLYGYCVGDPVYDPEGQLGWIDDIYENGTAEVDYSNGEEWYYNLDQLTPAPGSVIVVVHPWPECRPFPDEFYEQWPFPPPPFAYPYPWPYAYPYEFPGPLPRILPPCFPVEPIHIGPHPYHPYPYEHPVPYPNHPPIPAPIPHPPRPNPGAGCAVIGGSMYLTYSGCSFGNSAATWTGVQMIAANVGLVCGTFPSAGLTGFSRQAVANSGSTTPGMIVRTTVLGTTETIDDATANLGNFDGDTIGANIGSGYGANIAFSGGKRSGMTVAHHITSASFDHSVSGNLTISEASATAATRTITGTMTVYHNLLRVVGTSTFNSVVHSMNCCQPTGGSVTTTFAAGTNVTPRPLGLAMVGKTETLTFTGCGTATFTDTAGTTSTVSVNHCF